MHKGAIRNEAIPARRIGRPNIEVSEPLGTYPGSCIAAAEIFSSCRMKWIPSSAFDERLTLSEAMMRKLPLLIAVALLLEDGTPCLHADQASDRELPGQSVTDELQQPVDEKALAEKIGLRMNDEMDAWFQRPPESRRPYASMLQKVVDSLSDEEIPLIGRFQADDDFNQMVFRRWATKDHAAALSEARKVEDANAAEISLTGTGLEGGPGEAVCGYVFEMYLGAVEGWSQVDPKAAWDSFKKLEGPFSKSKVVEEFSSNFDRAILLSLAKLDPDFAFKEMMARGDDEFLMGRMLEGYLSGVPDHRDWKKDVDRLLERKWDREWVYGEIRCTLMGRWLEDDPEAAEKWFREGQVEGLHWFYNRLLNDVGDPFATKSAAEEKPPAPIEKKRYDLSYAVGFWAARDFAGALRWLKSHDGKLEDGFENGMLQGAESCLGDQKEALPHLMEQLGKIENQKDRDFFVLLIAKVLWKFDETNPFGTHLPNKDEWLMKVRQRLSKLQLSPEVEKGFLEKLK